MTCFVEKHSKWVGFKRKKKGIGKQTRVNEKNESCRRENERQQGGVHCRRRDRRRAHGGGGRARRPRRAGDPRALGVRDHAGPGPDARGRARARRAGGGAARPAARGGRRVVRADRPRAREPHVRLHHVHAQARVAQHRRPHRARAWRPPIRARLLLLVLP